MLTINKIQISGSASSVQQIFSALSSASVDSDPNNLHRYSADKQAFVSLLLEEDPGLGFQSAYIESAEMKDGSASAIVYTLNGNLSEWTGHVAARYGVEISAEIRKGVKYNSYGPDVSSDFDVTSLPQEPKKARS